VVEGIVFEVFLLILRFLLFFLRMEVEMLHDVIVVLGTCGVVEGRCDFIVVVVVVLDCHDSESSRCSLGGLFGAEDLVVRGLAVVAGSLPSTLGTDVFSAETVDAHSELAGAEHALSKSAELLAVLAPMKTFLAEQTWTRRFSDEGSVSTVVAIGVVVIVVVPERLLRALLGSSRRTVGEPCRTAFFEWKDAFFFDGGVDVAIGSAAVSVAISSIVISRSPSAGGVRDFDGESRFLVGLASFLELDEVPEECSESLHGPIRRNLSNERHCLSFDSSHPVELSFPVAAELAFDEREETVFVAGITEML
jgi:hypothetical protein